jgi:hypothetical protein
VNIQNKYSASFEDLSQLFMREVGKSSGGFDRFAEAVYEEASLQQQEMISR